MAARHLNRTSDRNINRTAQVPRTECAMPGPLDDPAVAPVPDGDLLSLDREFTPKRRSRRTQPPLTWWRQLPAAAFRAADSRILLRATRAAGSIDHPRWLAALTGDAPSAIGIAIKAVFKSEFSAPEDLVMTAVLRCAINGSLAAAMVLAAALHRRVTAEPHCDQLELSWYVADFSKTQRAVPRCHRRLASAVKRSRCKNT